MSEYQSNIDIAASVLQERFGKQWYEIAQELGTQSLCKRNGKDLTSFMSFPNRGTGGDNYWRGNCSPQVIHNVLKYALESDKYSKKPIDDFLLLDPMSGSGSSKAAADALNIKSVLYDLNPKPAYGIGGWNALTDDVLHFSDLIFFHPPYHSIVKYSGNMWGQPHADDLSRCQGYHEFIHKLNFVIQKLFLSLKQGGRLAILVGDVREKGDFFSIQRDMITVGKLEAFITKAQHNCASDSKRYNKPFIPIVTEYLLIYQKEDVFIVPVSYQAHQICDFSKATSVHLTWRNLLRMTLESMGGMACLNDVYKALASHPKSQINYKHWKEKIRQTLQNQTDFERVDTGRYALRYKMTSYIAA